MSHFVKDIATLLTICYSQEYWRQTSPRRTLLQAQGGARPAWAGAEPGGGRGGGRGGARGRGVGGRGRGGPEADSEP